MDRLTSRQIAEKFNINVNTLRDWRRRRTYDKRYPRFHKLITGQVYYIEAEFKEDFAKMEDKQADKMEMVI